MHACATVICAARGCRTPVIPVTLSLVTPGGLVQSETRDLMVGTIWWVLHVYPPSSLSLQKTTNA